MNKDRLLDGFKRVARSKFGRTALLAISLASVNDSGRINPPVENAYFCSNDHVVQQIHHEVAAGENILPFDRFMDSMHAVAIDRRVERAEGDPEYWHRVDKELNQDRVNILLFSFGELHEPPERELVTVGSPTLISHDTCSGSIDLISLTHEARTPEVERYLQEKGQFDGYAKTMDQAYFEGGFGLMRSVVESATGLSVDFQVAFPETVIADAIDKLFGSISVDVPLGFKTYPFHFREKWYPMGSFSKGEEKMDGTRAIQFMKTIPYEKEYNRLFENSNRKHALFGALMKTFDESDDDALFWWKVFLFLKEEINEGELTYDFDLKPLLTNDIGRTFRLISSILTSDSSTLDISRIRIKMYISDPANGDGGVQWIAASQNPIFNKELEAGFYRELATKVPYDQNNPFEANPNSSDLISEYWLPVRNLVRSSLLD